jgi:multidrug efflux pump subunit AcrB
VILKIDDGYTAKLSSVLDIKLDRNQILEKGLVFPQAPQTAIAIQSLNQTLGLRENLDKKILVKNGNLSEELDMYLVSQSESQKNDQNNQNDQKQVNSTDIENAEIFPGLKLGDVSNNQILNPKNDIQRQGGETLGVVSIRLKDDYRGQADIAKIKEVVLNEYTKDDSQKTKDLGLKAGDIAEFVPTTGNSFGKSLQELVVALIAAIIFSYFVLALFFNSLTQPIVIIFTIPLTFLGIFPALYYLGSGEFGFLEIIGLIILIGVVENVAIFLIDGANQKIEEGWDAKKAISYSSGIRFKGLILTKLNSIASLAPLALFSEQYRSISLVIMFGLLSSGFASMITTPILFIFFRWLSDKWQKASPLNRFLFLIPIFSIFYIIVWYAVDNSQRQNQNRGMKNVRMV